MPITRSVSDVRADIQPGLPRIADLVIAVVAMILAIPLFAAIAAAVAVSSGRPVIFTQLRAGRERKAFVLYKFRTMRRLNQGPHVTADGDVRITRIGRVLRKTKLDELPELWNVVKGDMALVGPRPEAVDYIDHTDLRWERILSVRPGLTDPVTLMLRNEQTVLRGAATDPERFYLDVLQPLKLDGYLTYLQRRTWWTDVKVAIATIAAIFAPSRTPPPTPEQLKNIKWVSR